MVLMTDLLFQIEEKEEVFREARRVLKGKGKVLVVDWDLSSSLGPKEGRVPPDEVKEIAKRMHFYLDKKFQAGSYHYGLVFVKQQ